MKPFMQSEPVLTIASVQAALVALIALAMEFGVDLTDRQVAAILGAYAAVAPLVAGVIARRKVTPTGGE